MRRVQLLHEGVMCWQWFEYLDPLRQRFDLAAQLRIAEVEVEYKIPQGVCIDISQFFFECIDVHRTKWKFIKSFRLVQIKSLAPERRIISSSDQTEPVQQSSTHIGLFCHHLVTR